MKKDKEKQDEKQVIFRFPDGYDRLLAKAVEHGVSPNILARRFCRMALDEGWADEQSPAVPPSLDELRSLIRKACFAVIVALSPNMDEAATDRFLAEVFDA